MIFFFLVSEKRIDDVVKAFQEYGNAHEGKVTRTVFKKVLGLFGERETSFKNEYITDALFERFKIDKSERVDKLEKLV